MSPLAAEKTKSIQAAKWDTAYIDNLPDSSFAYVDGKTRKLPYKDADGNVDLPHLRNALARLDQTDGIPASQKTQIRTKLENVLNRSKTESARTFSAVIVDDNGDLPTRIMLLRTGVFNTSKYGETEITKSDLDEMAQNFSQGVGLNFDGTTGAPINFGHDQGGQAAAWFKGLMVEPDEDGYALWADPVEWTQAGIDAVKGGMYKYISSECYIGDYGQWADYENTGLTARNVMEGAALTNIPMFTGLQPITASRTDKTSEDTSKHNVVFIKADKEQTAMPTLEEVVAKDQGTLTEEEKTFLVEHKDELTKEQQEKFGFEVTNDNDGDNESDKDKEQEQEPVADKQPEPVTASRDGQVSISADRLNALEATAKQYQTEKASSIVMAHVTRGAIKPADKDTWTNRLVASQGKDREELETLLNNLPDNKIVADKEIGSDATDEEISYRDRVVALAKSKVEAARKDGKELKIENALREASAELAESK